MQCRRSGGTLSRGHEAESLDDEKEAWKELKRAVEEETAGQRCTRWGWGWGEVAGSLHG